MLRGTQGGLVASVLPTGCIALVFTDIEGSTRLLREIGDSYVDVLDEHTRRVREAVGVCSGHVVHTEGDSFFLAFASDADAVAAAVQIQRDLAGGGWPGGRAPRVRIGVHRGDVALIGAGDDYVGLAVHEAARVMSLAHGGQILISDDLANAVVGALPPDVTLLDLGVHALKDFPAPRRLFQVCHPDMRSAFPPLRTGAQLRRSTLPAPPTRLIGRLGTLGELQRLVGGDARLVTLTGPGGVGKTRLAIELAWSVMNLFGGGTWFVDASNVRRGDDLLATIQRAVGAADVAGGDAIDAIRSALGTDRVLVAVDNLEQVVPDVAPLGRLLEGLPQLTLVATSRERLRLRAEHAIDVDCLDVESARDLLLERAAAAGVSLDGEDPGLVDVVDAVCAQVAHLPLAIEIAAARLRRRSLMQLRDELALSLDALRDGPVDAPERHRALRSTIAWSWDLLDDDERAALAAMAVVAGTAEASLVSSLTGAAHGIVDDVLDRLVEKSMVRPAEGKPDERRVRLLEPVRQYAWEQLREHPSREAAAVGGLVSWCLDLARKAEAHLGGPEQSVWVDRLELDRDNLLRSLECSEPHVRAQLCVALSSWWTVRGRWTEARKQIAAALDAIDDSDPCRGSLLASLAYFAERQGDLDVALSAAEDAKAMAGADLSLRARALNILGDATRRRGDADAARQFYLEARSVADEAHDLRQASVAASNLGLQAWEGRDNAEAARFWAEATALQEQVGDPRARAILANNMGLLRRAEGDVDAAEEAFLESLALARELGDPLPMADALLNLGTVAKDRGDEAAARARYFDALELFEQLGAARDVALTWFHLALATDEVADARRWLEEAKSIVTMIGDVQLLDEFTKLLRALDELEPTS